MIHVRDAARDGIEHLKGADELSRSKDLNFKATAGDRRDRAAKSFSAGVQLAHTLRDGRGRKCGGGAGNCAGPRQEAASIHGTFPLVFLCLCETSLRAAWS